jgi:hypothetical protein
MTGKHEDVPVSNAVVVIDANALAQRFEAIMNPKGQWKGDQLEPLRFMCRMLADDAVDYFGAQARGAEKLQ